jgi:hypothetical protein
MLTYERSCETESQGEENDSRKAEARFNLRRLLHHRDIYPCSIDFIDRGSPDALAPEVGLGESEGSDLPEDGLP